MKIAILGFAGQGEAAYEYWSSGKHEITICDQNTDVSIPVGAKSKLGNNYLDDLDYFDLLIRTPSLHPRVIAEANPQTKGILNKVTTVTNEFLSVCPTQNVIGVTGTKGKGTTSTLLSNMLEAAGKRVHLGGNIGIPPLTLLKNDIKPEDWVVLELANFQLIDLKCSPAIAVCLMIEPEHLDWHPNIDEYLDAKRQLFRHQAENDLAVYYAPNKYSLSIAEASPGILMPYMARPGAEIIEDQEVVIDGNVICKTNEINLLGTHNWQNVCAATTVAWQITHDRDALHKAISSFAGLPHRLEYVREIDGVRYYNDSFASVPGATVAAISAIPGQKVMVMGGYDRGLDLSELARTLVKHKEEIRRAVLFGASAIRTGEALQAHGFTNFDILKAKDMTEVVMHAKSVPMQGDSIVFSPGFPSFDMFRNFEERGAKFKEAVNAI